TVTYTNSGTYPINLTITSNRGCKTTNSASSVVFVYPAPVASYSINPQQTDIRTPDISFNNTSFGATDVTWHFGDGDSSNSFSVVHTYADTGTYPIYFFVENNYGCKDSISTFVRIDPFF